MLYSVSPLFLRNSTCGPMRMLALEVTGKDGISALAALMVLFLPTRGQQPLSNHPTEASRKGHKPFSLGPFLVTASSPLVCLPL